MPRVLVETSGDVERWEIRDDDGRVIGTQWVPVDTPEVVANRQLRQIVQSAIAANQAYVDSTPTPAQVSAQVKSLSTQMAAVERLLLTLLG